jgi:NAD(P)-dependent dehydrogenase (short-subunit alcohol dehydrogenase family)
VEIRGRTALISGGSRGLGAALGRELAERGARVVLLARGGEALDAVVARIRSGGGEAYGLVGDVGRPDDTHRLIGEAAALAGPPDLLVHAASSLGRTPLAPLVDTTPAELERVLQVNLLGAFRLTLAVAGSMLVRREGLVLAISSDAAVVPYARWGAYGVSKAALDHLMRIWAVELEGTGVRFLSLDPGEMDTEMHAAAMPEADRTSLRSPDEVARRIVAIVAAAESVPNGSRLDVARWERAA